MIFCKNWTPQNPPLPHLDVKTTQICIIRGKFCSVWGTLYVDKYGEDDIGFKRGKALYLQEDRFQLLYKQWITQTYDSICRNWMNFKGTL